MVVGGGSSSCDYDDEDGCREEERSLVAVAVTVAGDEDMKPTRDEPRRG